MVAVRIYIRFDVALENGYYGHKAFLTPCGGSKAVESGHKGEGHKARGWHGMLASCFIAGDGSSTKK